MTPEQRKQAGERIIALIQGLGYSVYMRNPDDAYCVYTDGTQIAYVQWADYLSRCAVSSVHKPSRDNGTGFAIADEVTAEAIKIALDCVAPSWGKGEVKKFRDLEDFRHSSEWNKAYTLVENVK